MTIVLLSLAWCCEQDRQIIPDEKTEKSLIKSGILDKQNGNVCLIDFIYFLWMLPQQLAATFGEVATFHADTVHIICDAYFNEPTIKDSKRDRRENTEATYSIQGCDQTRPTYFNSTLLSPSFKSSLIDFLAYEIRSQDYKDIINEKRVFYARKQSYIKVQVDNNEVIISGVDELSCSNNEAYTRILLHARYAAENTSSPHIVVRASDTGIFFSFSTLLLN